MPRLSQSPSIRLGYLKGLDHEPEGYTKAKRRLGRLLRTTWRQAVNGAILPGMTGRVRSQTYRDGIGDYVLDNTGVRVSVEGDAAQRAAHSIEYGHARIDIGKILLSGPSARRSKTGEPYVIVPIVHSTSSRSARGSGIPQAAQKLLARRAAPAGGASSREPAFQPQNHAERVPYGVSPRPHMNQGRRKSRMTAYRQKYGHLSGLAQNKQISNKGGLITFRTVTGSNVAAGGWVIPPRTPNPVIASVKAAALAAWRSGAVDI